jgi:polyhydroxyalkanoate synthesis regulator phasin
MTQAMKRYAADVAFYNEYAALKKRLDNAYDNLYAARPSHVHGCQMEVDALMQQMRDLTVARQKQGR